MAKHPNHNEHVKKYRHNPRHQRIEMLLPPELRTRYQTLLGLERATHAERMTALCDLWEQTHGKVEALLPGKTLAITSAPAVIEPATAPAANSSLPQVIDFDSLLGQIDAVDAELAADELAEAEEASGPAPSPAAGPLDDWELPRWPVPPFPAHSTPYYREIIAALHRLYESEWPRHRHGNTEEAKRWKQLLREESDLLQAFRALTSNKEELAQLICHYCLLIRPNDILAWAELKERDREAVLWHLVHAGGIYPAVLGEVRERFEQALKRQPARESYSWKRKV